MALIIRAAPIAAVSRQLRRPAAPAAAAIPAPASAEADAAPPQRELPAPQARPAQPMPAQQPAPAEHAETLRQAAQLRQDQQHLQAARDQLAEEKQQLAAQLDLAQAAQRQLQDEAGQIKAEAERLGYAQGRQQAEREAAEATAVRLARLDALMQALSQSKRALLDENQDLLVEIAFAAVCRMLGASAASRPGLESMVGELIAAERAPETLRVRVHPQDLTLMSGDVSGLDPRLEFLPDSSIELGGCMIDGPRGTIDARLELQLQHLRATLLLVRQQRSQDEAPV